MMIKLFKVFHAIENKRTYSWQELRELDVQASFVKDMERRLGLVYVEGQIVESEVCLMNSAEVRPEYKITFGKMDLLNYIQGRLPGPGVDLAEDEVAFPESSADLWAV